MNKLSKKTKAYAKAMKMELREHKSSFMVYTILRILVIVSMIRQILNGNYENVFLCFATLVLLMVPSFIQLELRVELPTALEITILLFIFAAEILGEINEFYVKIYMWDTVLHTLNGFLAAAIGFSMIDLLNRKKKEAFNLSPFYLAMVAFCFSMTIGVLWEFFEFAMDHIFMLDMQKDTVINYISSVKINPDGKNVPVIINDIESVIINGEKLPVNGYLDIGLIDTMKDLFVNFIGAVVFSFIGYFYVKSRGENKTATRFIPTPKEESADFLTQAEDESNQ